MNKMSKRIIAITLLIGTGFASTIHATILHSIRSEEVVTKGATHIHEKLLTDKGWRNVNILKVDLADSNILVQPMESSSGLERQTILQMVQDSGAVAGVNADYFDMGTNNSPSLGMLIDKGELLHGYNSKFSSLGINKNMATFMIDENNLPSMEYYGVNVTITSNGNVIGEAGAKNIIASSVSKPTILDSHYYKSTNEIVAKHPTLYTIVVQDGYVSYQSLSGEGVDIPDGGYVILIPEKDANSYYSSLPVGASVEIEEKIYMSSDISTAVSSMKLGIGGSGIIMKNGEAYTGNAHAVTPNADVARTIVASVKGTNEILLVTVDKAGDYVGINQSELIELLKRYNVADAMYFDGGGSTTFVSRDEGAMSPTLKNKPTGGEQRKVINGVGVFTTSPMGNVAKLKVTPSSNRTFVGESISFNVNAFDENNNPVPIDSSSLGYSVASGDGYFSGNTLVPTKAGSLLVVVSFGGVEVGVEISVEDIPKGLVIEPSLLQLDANGTKELNVYGLDSKGYKIPISGDKVIWNSDNANIRVSNNIVSANGDGVAKVIANYNGAMGQVGVIVGKIAVPVDSLENNAGKWAGDTNTVTGEVAICDKPVYHGSKAIKMTYSFKPSSSKQVAYTVFDSPIPIQEDASSINMWLYGKNQGHTAKIEVVDSKGKTYYLKLTDSIDFTGWKYVSAAIPEEVSLPAKVTKFYTYANMVSEEIKTAVCIDHISITRGFRNSAGITARADYLYDPFYKESLQAPTGSQYVINVVGPTRLDSMVLNNESIAEMSKKLVSGASALIKVSTKNSQLASNITEYTYNNCFEEADYKNTKIIMVGTAKGGIRATNPDEWNKLKTAIDSSDKMDNIMIVMSCNPLTQFEDAMEGKAFHDYLVGTKTKTGKNIFVVYSGGTSPEVRIEDGIRYIRTNGINVTTDSYKEGSFVKFKIDGTTVYYTIEKLN